MPRPRMLLNRERDRERKRWSRKEKEEKRVGSRRLIVAGGRPRRRRTLISNPSPLARSFSYSQNTLPHSSRFKTTGAGPRLPLGGGRANSGRVF